MTQEAGTRTDAPAEVGVEVTAVADPGDGAPRDAVRPAVARIDLDDPSLYVNRELSWLDFNMRVLEEAYDERNPLIERLRFLAITANNLDEFLMVRVSGLKQQVEAGVRTLTADGLTPSEQLVQVDLKTQQMLADMGRCFEDVLAPELRDEGLAIRSWEEVNERERAQLGDIFREQIFPVLTPLAVDPAHPFPYISNLSLNLAVLIRDPHGGRELFARVKVPQTTLGRFVHIPDTTEVVALEQVCAAHVGMLFPGMEVLECHLFRVVRDSDIEIEEAEAEDLVDEIETGVRSRRFRSVVDITVEPTMRDRMRQLLAVELNVPPERIFTVPGLLGMADLMELCTADRPDLMFRRWSPQAPDEFVEVDGEPVDIFSVIRQRDVLVHHPYESFAASVEAFINRAVDDPRVLAIKQTLYRTTQDSANLRALVRAAEAGKQVVVVVEIKARFDEERNIVWGKRLEASGAHVVYGMVGLKTHSKAVLVVRQERDGIRRYVHLGTGNYNSSTARLYEDIGLMSCRPELGADLSDLFNFLTGYSRQREFRRLLVAPYSMRSQLEARIDREIDHARDGRPAVIQMKMNSIVDASLIRKLYEASQAGVEIDLIVRGICCLRAGVPGVSDNIRVRSIVGRFLEHSRIYHFGNDGDPEYLIGSADIMPRNLDRRVESLVPVQDRTLQHEMRDVLDINLADNRQARELHADGTWHRLYPEAGEPERATQEALMQLALQRSQPT